MTETSNSMVAPTTDDDLEVTSQADTTQETSPSTDRDAGASSADRRVRYCPTCQARYVKAASECVACAVPLVDEQPRDFSIFRPELDVPFVLALGLYIYGYNRLNGEAQSFGLIFLIVGFATLITFRAISYVEWLGRR
jgi:hypothetical protein